MTLCTPASGMYHDVVTKRKSFEDTRMEVYPPGERMEREQDRWSGMSLVAISLPIVNVKGSV